LRVSRLCGVVQGAGALLFALHLPRHSLAGRERAGVPLRREGDAAKGGHRLKLKGKGAYRDLETGVWVLEGDDGRTYQLAGGDRKIKKDGARIEVDGDVVKGAITIGMVGPVFRVKTYRFV